MPRGKTPAMQAAEDPNGLFQARTRNLYDCMHGRILYIESTCAQSGLRTKMEG
jgi:hypothetical protein